MTWDDCEIPQFFSERVSISRKEHKCCECGRSIRKGMKYWYCSGKWDGRVSGFKQHIECRDACYAVQMAEHSCIPFGELQEWLFESGNHRSWDESNDNKITFSELGKEVRSLYAKGMWSSRLKTQAQIDNYNLGHKSR